MATFQSPNFAGFMGGLGLLCVGAGILILIEFWYLFVIGGVGYAGYKVYKIGK